MQLNRDVLFQNASDPRRRAMKVSLLVSFLMLVGKMGAFWLTGSAAIYSDAVESVIHLIATAFVAFSLWYAVQPPDRTHPYGHGKVAYFSSGFEGGLILVAALAIIYSAVHDLITGPELHQLGTGLLIIAGLSGINGGLGWYLIHTGRRHGSLVLISNGQHVLTDMWTSVGVLVGVGLVWLTGQTWLDPLVAIGVALNILWTAYELLRRAVEGLMEKAEGADTEAILQELERARREGLIASYHQLRHRRIENQVWIEYHLLFSTDLTITQAHDRSHRVEEAIDERFPDDLVYVTAHLEPEHHDVAHPEGHSEPADPLRKPLWH